MNLDATILLAMGTSEGAIKGWDTRCRGRHGEYGFVSHNTEEGLNFEQAAERLDSPQQQAAITRAKELLSTTLGTGTVRSAIGDWQDGAENSSVIFSKSTDSRKLDYMMASLGSELKQKAVISFSYDKNGDDAVWTLNTQKGMKEVRDALDQAGVKYRTLVPGRAGTTVHIFDQGTELGDSVHKAAQTLGASVNAIVGTGKFIGGDTREEGEKAYQQIIEGYRKNATVGIAGGRGDRGQLWIRGRGPATQEVSFLMVPR